jgi:hypothetical protein
MTGPNDSVTPPRHDVPMTETTPTPSEQLRLLDTPVPAALRLDPRTRRVGLAGVAHARALLAEQARRRAAREADQEVQRRHPPAHPAAA